MTVAGYDRRIGDGHRLPLLHAASLWGIYPNESKEPFSLSTSGAPCSNSKPRQRCFCRVGFRFLLARALAAAQFAPLPFDDHLIETRVSGTRFGNASIGRRLIAFGLEFLLKASLRVGPGGRPLFYDGGKRWRE